jgi:hypothetical protein
MKRIFSCLLMVGAVGGGLSRLPAEAACCYFSAVGQDVNQPAQKAFLTWDPQEQVESFTVQPRFEGNAKDFGMVIPTPTRPRLFEMPRDFFKELAVFTILRPTPKGKFRTFGPAFGGSGGFGGGGMAGAGGLAAPRPRVEVLESGLVGSLDYKILKAEEAGDLYRWLKGNGYTYAGDEETLDYYLKKRWFFTVMKIDPMQQKRREDGSYQGSVSPTRFVFSSDRLVYPLRITRLSIKEKTEALFYVQGPRKMDLPGPWSYQLSWLPMWRQAMGMAYPQRLTAQERDWQPVAEAAVKELDGARNAASKQLSTWEPTRLDWAKRLDTRDLAMVQGTVQFDRQADLSSVQQLKILQGHLREQQWLTKLRKTFRPAEMEHDLEFVPAALGGQVDEMEYTYAYPTSPP